MCRQTVPAPTPLSGMMAMPFLPCFGSFGVHSYAIHASLHAVIPQPSATEPVLEQVLQAHVAGAEAHLGQDGRAQQRHRLAALLRDES